MRLKPPPTLRARAIGWLAQREQSRSELRLKLLRRARADAKAGAAAGTEAGVPDPLPAVEQVLDALEAEGHLSATRFAASRVHARAARYGNLRIRLELAQHGVTIGPDAAGALQASELERARAVWSRKFGAPAADAAGRARQARFLAGRGFSGGVIAQIVRRQGEPE